MNHRSSCDLRKRQQQQRVYYFSRCRYSWKSASSAVHHHCSRLRGCAVVVTTVFLLFLQAQALLSPCRFGNVLALSSSSSSSSSSQPVVRMKHILVTGGNKGIGKAVCERLLTEWTDTVVILGCRDVTRGNAAVQDILSAAKTKKTTTMNIDDDADAAAADHNRISVLELDTSSDASVQAAAATLQKQFREKRTVTDHDVTDKDNDAKQKHPLQLYGIVNNAGIGWGYSVKDTIETNYFGPRRVNDAFINASLLQSPGGRIVNVGSASGPNFVQSLRDDDDDDDSIKKKLAQPWTIQGGVSELDALARTLGNSRRSESKTTKDGYGISKALLNAYTHLHAREHSHSNSNHPPPFIINSVTPGWIATDLTAGTGASNPPARGAIPICALLMDAKFENAQTHPTGRYYGSDGVRSPLHYYRGPGEPPYECNDDL